MTGSLSTSKGLWAGASVAFALSVALVSTIAQGYLWEGPNARSNKQLANAAEISSTAEIIASDAAQKDAMNTLQAAIEQANAVIRSANTQATAMIGVANLTSQAQRIAAKDQAEAVIVASKEVSKAQNAEYDQITRRFFGDPVEKADELNTQIVRLENELQSGRDSKTGHGLSLEDLVARQDKLEALQMEHKIQSEITSKNWNDAIRMMTGATDGLFGGLSSLYPNSSTPPAPPRRIIEER